MCTLQVVAWKPGVTQVSITFNVRTTTNGVRYNAGATCTQNLQQYQVLLVYLSGTQQQDIDMTNNMIIANQSVAAFTGNWIAILYGTGDHSWEQLMPITSWGTQFALVGAFNFVIKFLQVAYTDVRLWSDSKLCLFLIKR